jgi:hypothetical protein
MAEENTNNENAPQYGTTLYSWDYESKPHYTRGLAWYVGMGIAGVFLLLYAVFSGNFLFALIILMFALIIYLSIITGPDIKTCAITETGLLCGKTFYPYQALDRFWFAYDPPIVKKLYIVQKGRFSPLITLQLEQQNPNKIREQLGQFMREDLDRGEEPLSDVIGRMLKI